MIVVFKIKNDLGEFVSEEIVVTEEQYENILEMSKSFYEGVYDMRTPNGFVVIPPDVVRKSVLIIEKK
jgi:hypothetical protein